MENGEKLYNYLEAYETDSFARRRGYDPIEFDWSRVCNVEIEDVDSKWDETETAKRCAEMGKPRMKVLVHCPNPNHGYFNMIIHKFPTPRDSKCYHCITEEMNRILSLRTQREMELKRGEI